MLALLELSGIAFGLVIVLLFVTQIVIPFVKGTPFFPQFRKITPLKVKIEDAEIELEETTELVHLQKQLDEINRRKAELEGK
jgi:hypothetical protein